MALKINVKPGEKIVINGAVITMGEGASYIVLQNQATFLREKDIMQQEDATTPVRRIYFSLMLMYLDQDNYQNYYNDYMDRMIELMRSTGLAQIRDTLMVMFRDVQERRFFQALKACKALMKVEEELLKENSAMPAGERVFTLADNKA